jgi:hypothetical protein
MLDYHNTQNQLLSLVESDVKNTLPTKRTAMDMVGLTWIFKKDVDILEDLK